MRSGTTSSCCKAFPNQSQSDCTKCLHRVQLSHSMIDYLQAAAITERWGMACWVALECISQVITCKHQDDKALTYLLHSSRCMSLHISYFLRTSRSRSLRRRCCCLTHILLADYCPEGGGSAAGHQLGARPEGQAAAHSEYHCTGMLCSPLQSSKASFRVSSHVSHASLLLIVYSAS